MMFGSKQESTTSRRYNELNERILEKARKDITEYVMSCVTHGGTPSIKIDLEQNYATKPYFLINIKASLDVDEIFEINNKLQEYTNRLF